jgi:hypothetical protein
MRGWAASEGADDECGQRAPHDPAAPFNGDSPPATGARILTQPPHFDGLTGTLRDLVGLALAKVPRGR